MFGERLKEVGVKYFGTLKKMAEVSGVNYSQVSDYVNNRRQPRFEALNAFANVGINVQWLLTGEGSMMINDDTDYNLIASIAEVSDQLNAIVDSQHRLAAGRLPDKSLQHNKEEQSE